MTSDSQLMDSRDVDSTEENENAKEDVAEQWEKGYDLPIDEPERKEAEDECKMILELISDIYTQADKGEAVNTVLDERSGNIRIKDGFVMNYVFRNRRRLQRLLTEAVW